MRELPGQTGAIKESRWRVSRASGVQALQAGHHWKEEMQRESEGQNAPSTNFGNDACFRIPMSLPQEVPGIGLGQKFANGYCECLLIPWISCGALPKHFRATVESGDCNWLVSA